MVVLNIKELEVTKMQIKYMYIHVEPNVKNKFNLGVKVKVDCVHQFQMYYIKEHCSYYILYMDVLNPIQPDVQIK